ncbi:MAG: hypothetical protein WC675_02445 [Patescibacteria group bacterium]|jgi:hypothetical protein
MNWPWSRRDKGVPGAAQPAASTEETKRRKAGLSAADYWRLYLGVDPLRVKLAEQVLGTAIVPGRFHDRLLLVMQGLLAQGYDFAFSAADMIEAIIVLAPINQERADEGKPPFDLLQGAVIWEARRRKILAEKLAADTNVPLALLEGQIKTMQEKAAKRRGG